MSSSKMLREFRKIAEAEGVKVIEVIPGFPYGKVVVENAAGQRDKFPVRSMSDGNAATLVTLRAALRRFARGVPIHPVRGFQ